ncbi:hypothetical protein BJX63DRAFT_167395 [Aspergillus granulosus]|uniref:Diaminohydroxyphosphoribosylamino-pyrimidine deaminase n=1 Tax=Aspergillus granulosus TaxID=176169 RepID=A0ABR4HJ85_9EURO
MEDLSTFLSSIGHEVEDADEESFLLFSQEIPSSNLGFVDSKATTVDITIHGQDYTIHQSPTLLSSSRAGGTTGAVLWKITPLFAEWLSNTSTNPLWTSSHLTSNSTVVELGCGISGLTALTLAPLVGHYLATDQEYVARLFRQNLESNPPQQSQKPASGSGSGSGSKGKSKGRRQQPPKGKPKESSSGALHPNITFVSLDWELDNPARLRQEIPNLDGEGDNDSNPDPDPDTGFDLLLSCDCIYNESLIAPFVRTCSEIAALRRDTSSGRNKPTICMIAQQQRSPDVFEAWLRETMRVFRVWRVDSSVLGGKLGEGSGYLTHALLLKD